MLPPHLRAAASIRAFDISAIDSSPHVGRYFCTTVHTSMLLRSIFIPDPFASELLEKGFNKVWDIRDQDVNIKCWMFDKEFAIKNKEFIDNFHTCLNRATEKFNSLSLEEQKEFLVKYDFTSTKKRTYEISEKFREKDFKLASQWFCPNENLIYEEEVL